MSSSLRSFILVLLILTAAALRKRPDSDFPLETLDTNREPRVFGRSGTVAKEGFRVLQDLKGSFRLWDHQGMASVSLDEESKVLDYHIALSYPDGTKEETSMMNVNMDDKRWEDIHALLTQGEAFNASDINHRQMGDPLHQDDIWQLPLEEIMQLPLVPTIESAFNSALGAKVKKSFLREWTKSIEGKPMRPGDVEYEFQGGRLPFENRSTTLLGYLSYDKRDCAVFSIETTFYLSLACLTDGIFDETLPTIAVHRKTTLYYDYVTEIELKSDANITIEVIVNFTKQSLPIHFAASSNVTILESPAYLNDANASIEPSKSKGTYW